MVAREHPEPPKRAVVEEALRVYRAELVAEAAADATRARRRGTTRDGGAVAPLPVAPEALRGLAEALKRALPSPGGRHHYRLAAAAWLLAEGVPATVVAKVLPATSTEDARDAAKAVEDTVRRVASDKRVRSAGFLSRVLGEGGFQALSDALEADLAAAGVASRGFARTRRALDEAPVPEREVASDEVAGVLAELLAADLRRADAALAQGGEQALAQTPIRVVVVTPGGGKTHATQRCAAEDEGRAFSFSVVTNTLAKQIKADLETMTGEDVLRRAGILTFREDGEPVCRIFATASAVQASETSAGFTLCKLCPHKLGCTARGGMDGPPGARLKVAPHQLVVAVAPVCKARDEEEEAERLTLAPVLFLDEPPPVVKAHVLTPEDLERALPALEEEARLALDPDEDQHLERGIATAGTAAVALARDAARLLAQAKPDTLTAREALDRALAASSSLRQAINAACESFGLSTSAPDLLAALVACLRGIDFSTPFTEQARRSLARDDLALAERLKDAVRVARVLASWLTRLEGGAVARWDPDRAEGALVVTTVEPSLLLAFSLPALCVVLDGTADLAGLAVVARLAGRPLEVTAVHVRDGAPVERVLLYSANATRKALMPHGRIDWSRVGPHIADGLERAGARPGRRVLVATFKEIADRLREALGDDHHERDLSKIPHERARRVLAASGLQARDVAHYGSVRGLNDYQDVVAAVSIGDPRPNVGEAEDAAELLGLEAGDRANDVARSELAQVHGRPRCPRRTVPVTLVHVGALVPRAWHRRNASLERVRNGRPPGPRAMTAAEVADATRVVGRRELARRVGLDPGTVGQMARGRRPVPDSVAKAIREAMRFLPSVLSTRTNEGRNLNLIDGNGDDGRNGMVGYEVSALTHEPEHFVRPLRITEQGNTLAPGVLLESALATWTRPVTAFTLSESGKLVTHFN